MVFRDIRRDYVYLLKQGLIETHAHMRPTFALSRSFDFYDLLVNALINV